MKQQRFRILEKTTFLDTKKYVPQRFGYTTKTTEGMLWWKKTIETELWFGLKLETRIEWSHKMIVTEYSDNEGTMYSSIEEAKKAIEQYKLDAKEREDAISDSMFKSEITIIHDYDATK